MMTWRVLTILLRAPSEMSDRDVQKDVRNNLTIGLDEDAAAEVLAQCHTITEQDAKFYRGVLEGGE